MSDISQEIKFAPGEEFCADVLGPVNVTVQNGHVEFYGTPLHVGVPYSFPSGATILLRSPKTAANESIALISGRVAVQGTSKSCVYSAALQTFLEYLNTLRKDTQRTDALGPAVLVCGQKGAGKSTFCRTLCNAAIDSDFNVQYVDLNTANNSVSFPRHIASVTVEDYFPVEGSIENRFPDIFAYDSLQPPREAQESAWKLFEGLCFKIQSLFKRRASCLDPLRQGGIIVEAPSELFPHSPHSIHPLLFDIVRVFGIRYICVIGQGDSATKALAELKAFDLQKACIFQHFPFLSRKAMLPYAETGEAEKVIRNYFMGKSLKLQCFRMRIDYTKIHFYRTVFIGDASEGDVPAQAVSIDLSIAYRDCVARVASVTDASCPEEVLTAKIVGFVIIASVNPHTKEIELITPFPGPIPRQHIMVTGLTTEVPELLCS